MNRWLSSFRYAYEGLKYALHTQRNMKFHFLAAFGTLLLALLLDLSKLEILFLLLAVVLVIMTELINTAVEKTVDLAMPELHPVAKIAKDVAAASVLVTAAFAACVGLIVFYEPVDRLIHRVREQAGPNHAAVIGVMLALVVMSIIVAQTRFLRKPQASRPSLVTAVAFAVATLIVYYAPLTPVILLSGLLALLILVLLAERKGRSLPSLALGGLIGATVTVLALALIHFMQKGLG